MPNVLPGGSSPGHDVAIAVDPNRSNRSAEYRRVDNSSILIDKTWAVAHEGATTPVAAVVGDVFIKTLLTTPLT